MEIFSPEMRVVFVESVRCFYPILTKIRTRRKILVKASGRKFCANPFSGPETVTYRTPDMTMLLAHRCALPLQKQNKGRKVKFESVREHAVKAHGGKDVQRLSFLTLALDGSEWSALRLGHLTSGLNEWEERWAPEPAWTLPITEI